jgi:hypothetical protein
MNTYTLFSQVYLDKYNQCYKNIITCNVPPRGPLEKILRRVIFYPLSTFKQPGPCSLRQTCGIGFVSMSNSCHLMTTCEIPELFSFLLANGYKIDTSITKMLNDSDIQIVANDSKKIICFITYTG